MARIKSKKYNGIYLNHLQIGKKSDGINEIIANVKRSEFIKKVLKPNDYIIGSKATRLSTNALSVTLRPLLNTLFNEGLDKSDRKNRVIIHTLRHTFSSHLVINGTPIFTVKSLMNHRDINMTMRYAELAPDNGVDMVRGLYGDK